MRDHMLQLSCAQGQARLMRASLGVSQARLSSKVRGDALGSAPQTAEASVPAPVLQISGQRIYGRRSSARSAHECVDIVLFFVLLRVGVILGWEVSHEFELRCRSAQAAIAFTASPRSVSKLPPLSFDLRCPLLHHIFGGESDDEILNAWVAFPKDLTRI